MSYDLLLIGDNANEVSELNKNKLTALQYEVEIYLASPTFTDTLCNLALSYRLLGIVFCYTSSSVLVTVNEAGDSTTSGTSERGSSEDISAMIAGVVVAVIIAMCAGVGLAYYWVRIRSVPKSELEHTNKKTPSTDSMDLDHLGIYTTYTYTT